MSLAVTLPQRSWGRAERIAKERVCMAYSLTRVAHRASAMMRKCDRQPSANHLILYGMISWGGMAMQEGMRLLALATVSLALGLGINTQRPQPLPLRYESPEARLSRVVRQMGVESFAQSIAVPEVGLAALRTTVEEKNALLIDARAPLFYEYSHLPGARPLARIQFAPDYAALKEALSLNGQRRIIVYCAGDDCHDSELVAAALVRLGHQRVTLFRGGFAAWKKAGLPLESGR